MSAFEKMHHQDLPLSGKLKINAGQYSHRGVKQVNEDAIGIRIPDGLMLTTKGAVSVICDGVSAAEAAEKASHISVTNFISDYYSTPDTWGVKRASSQVLTALNRWLFGLGQDYRDARKGYVSTFTALIFKSCSAHLLHVGDSRAYRFRHGELERISRDHISVLNANKRYLARALGLDVKLDVDYRQLALQSQDYYLLTTDGVHDLFSDSELSEILSLWLNEAQEAREVNARLELADLALFCRHLCEIAIERGSEDNVSCQLLGIETLPSQDINDVYQQLSSQPFPPPLSVGMKLDNYLIKQVLHQSQRSQVYLAVNQEGRQVCLKTPSVNYLDDAAYIERFMLESWIGHRIHSPNVVKLLDRDQPKSALYYVTEHLNGMPLSVWISRNPNPSIQEVLMLLKQLESGVRAFHRKETLHQDLKPDNILLTQEGQIKIIDFGSCYIKGVAEITTPLQRDSVLGTADYSAPESVLGYRVSNRADLFSLAVIAFEMLTGELPFKGRLARCRTKADYQDLIYIPCYELNPLIPTWIDQTLKRALSLDPNHRHGDTSEFIYALQQPIVVKDKREFELPLLETNPVIFWRATTLFFALSTLLLLLFL
ncbi:bifunctional protein-serine/threonine kinase/phosphatase [Shewanella woodyi]|uniref:bifunctional protein-serine/threonine kinase/phosphatase n=1 Tax=Shewanella woodyi TaxID=60961 RepID=UPI0009EE49FA|nr:bifunctional protein-serine/threonine kinase/phosphatase [Shewanella woodyi]